jgi:hypothetical protein
LQKRNPLFISDTGNSWALALFSAFSFFTVALGWIAGLEKVSWASLYFGAVIVSLFLGSMLGFRWRQVLKDRPVTLKSILSWHLVLGFFAFLLLLAPNFFRYSPWFDETTQFFFSVYPTDHLGVTDFAAIQQQPPLSYFFSQFFRLTMGNTAFALRASVVLFSFLLILSTSFFANKQKLDPIFYLIWISFFLVQSEHAQYFIEARPIVVGIFLSFMVWLRLKEWVDGNEALWFELISWSTFLLLTLGYQSCFYLLLLPIIVIPQLRSKKYWRAFLLVALIPGLLCALVWFNVFLKSIVVDQFHLDQTFSQRIHQLFLMKTSLWLFAEAGGYVFLLSCILYVTFLFYHKGKQWLQILVSFGSFGLLFPFFVLFTWSFINWGFFPKYFVLWISGLYFLCLNILPQKQKSYLSLASATVLILIFSIWFYPEERRRLKAQFLEHPDWRKIAEYLKTEAETPHGFAYVSLSKKESAAFDFLTGRLYAKEKSVWLYPCFNTQAFCGEKIDQAQIAKLPRYYLILDFLDVPIVDRPIFRNLYFISNKQAVLTFSELSEMEKYAKLVSSTNF